MRPRLVLAGGLVIIAGLLWALLLPRSAATPTSKSHERSGFSLSVPMASPLKFMAPSIGLIAPIEEVGKTEQGEMNVPAALTVLGWYKYGVFPGNKGPAVLAGHTGYPEKPSPFKRLNELHKGDLLQVEDAHGRVASFEVAETATYPTEASPRSRIFGETNTAQLTIITCAGNWLPERQTYTHRLVIYSLRKE